MRFKRPAILFVLALLIEFVTSKGIYAELQTVPLGTVSGHVTFAGNPVQKAILVMISLNGTDRSTVTNKDGSYTLGQVRPGAYLMTVIHPQLVQEGEGADAGYVSTLVQAGNSRMDFAMVKGGVISGSVCDATGKPVVRQQIFYEKMDRMSGFPFMRMRPRVVTNDLGEFRIYGLPAGKYVVGLGKDLNAELGALGAPFKPTLYRDADDISQAEVIALETGAERALGQFKAVTKAKSFSVEIKFVDETGDGVADLEFDLIKSDQRERSTKTTLHADREGSISIDNLMPSKYRIVPAVRNGGSDAPGFASKFFEIVDQNVPDIIITCDTSTADISGIIRIGEASARTDDCRLMLKEGNDLLAADKQSYDVEIKNGAFHISGLRRGVYTLLIVPKRQSLQYASAEMDGALFVNNQTVGQLQLDLHQGSKSVTLHLAPR
jgi:uncharacterized membrane protein